MPRSTLVLVAAPGALDPALVARAEAILHGTAVWLSPREAAEIPADAADRAALTEAFGDAPVDVLIVDEPRRKRLLVADMDSTMVEGETLDELAAMAGIGEAIAAITRRSMNGEIDFAAALRERVALLRDLEAEAIGRVPVRLNPGARTLVATMRAHGAHTALVSGGFTQLTARAALLAGFDAHHGNVLDIRDGRLTGMVAEPILDRDAKRAILLRLAAERGIPVAETLATGDGANDLAMLTAAGLGVAYRAKPVVTAAVPNAIRHADLRALLFAQGFAATSFAG